MEFLTLFKKYVMSNESETKKLYLERFNSESSFHIDLNIGKHDAFFFGHPVIYEKVAFIYKQDREVLNSFSQLPPVAQEHYAKRCLIDEVQYTNEIEGVVSTRKEINEIINYMEKNKNPHNNRLEGIVNSYLKLHNKDNILINSSMDIRNIYNELLLHEISIENPKNIPDGIIFRKDTVEVDNFDGTKIHSGVYPEQQIISYMEKSLAILKSQELDPLISTCIFHYLFGYIHPFYDGNGRTSRFITSYLLSKCLCPITAFRISMTIKENLSDYYKAFKETNDPRNMGDIATFVNSMLDIIIKAQNKTIIYAKEKRNDLDYLMSKVNNGAIPERELNFLYVLIQASLFSKEGITMNNLIAILKMDNKTISCYVSKYSNLISINTTSREYLYSFKIDSYKN